jgi:hypothetical protein
MRLLQSPQQRRKKIVKYAVGGAAGMVVVGGGCRGLGVERGGGVLVGDGAASNLQ